MIADVWPAEDATVLRYGLRRLLTAIPGVLLLLGGGVLGCWIAATGEDIGLAWILVVILMALGPAGVILFVSRWRARRWTVAFDATGFWWVRGKEAALIRWDSLAGVGVYWARNRNQVVFTLELCPSGEIDRDDPLLWTFVRDADPLRPELPRLRYRFDVGGAHKKYENALNQWAPELWFGRKEQPMSYLGSPDEKGHRERTAAQPGSAAREPVVFEPVDIGDTVVVHRGVILARRRIAVALPTIALYAWITWLLVHGHAHGVGAFVRYAVAVLPVLLTGVVLRFVVRGLRWQWSRRVTMDAAGFHVSWRGRSTTVAWDSLAGVGIYEEGWLRTLQLCPKGGIDRDDPQLWLFVRDSEPLRPDLPRLRYSVSLQPSDARHAVAAGCLRWAPDLWFGGQRMASGHSGDPDLKGHRRRTRGTGGRAVTPAP
ncbi:hypothetical protein ACH4S8_11730 [Streptomyces sp. NPDC021080]|uniref:hypothetical protein n=1 Tax=Streptomyces sp. NPDC021080 TaxID=3365110 RepID=UPI0037B334F4